MDEAVRVAGGVPGGFPAKVDVPLRSEQRADTAAAAVLRALLEVIEANLEGTIEDLDSEFLHDMRVSVRRSRAVQRELQGVFPPRTWLVSAPSSAGCNRSPETPATSTFTCSSSNRCARSCRRRCRTTSIHCSTCCVRDARRRTGSWSMICAPSAPPGCCRRGERFWTGSRRPTRASARTRRGRSATSRASGSARCTGGWCGWAMRSMIEPGPGLPRAAQEGQGAALPTRAVRGGALSRRGRQADDPTSKVLQYVLGRDQEREVEVALSRLLATDPLLTARPGSSPAEAGGQAPRLAVGATARGAGLKTRRRARDESAGRFEEFAAKDQRRLVAQTFGP